MNRSPHCTVSEPLSDDSYVGVAAIRGDVWDCVHSDYNVWDVAPWQQPPLDKCWPHRGECHRRPLRGHVADAAG